MSANGRVLGALLAASSAACGSTSPMATDVTYNKHIAPIVYANCVTCHRPGEAAPFSLVTYADAVAHADDIGNETMARHMPPWLPEPGEFVFQHQRVLRPEQIETIQRWIATGHKEGDAADLPKAPVFPDGWALGPPDMVLTQAKPYMAAASANDVYRNLVFHTTVTADTFVRALEFKTNGAPIHHAVIRVDRTTASRRHDGQDGQPGFDGMSSEGVQDPPGQFVGWAPGRGPIVSPDGMPWRLEKGTDLVVELHIAPSTKAAAIQPAIGLFLTSTPPVATAVVGKLTSKVIDIPAGDRAYVATSTFELPVDADLMSVYPHAHYLATDMRATATLPDGTKKQLLWIKRWSFHWQQDYRYVTPIPLPRGTKLTMRYTYDNSNDNPANPRHPPVRVQIGSRSVDEMAEFTVQLLPKSPSDATTLAYAFEDLDRRATVQMAEMRARNEPGNAKYQAFLGAAYVASGRFADAVAPLKAALRLDDGLASAHSDLGTALMETDRLSEALAHLSRAAALSPRDENVYFNLGNALGRANRLAEAEAAFGRALAINPDFPDAYINLAGMLLRRGARNDAVARLRRATELVPDSPSTHNSLGSALAASGRFQDALKEVQKALALQPGFAPAQENLRRLHQLGIK
jgi:tetratricopeptide (TPR) repeat protein